MSKKTLLKSPLMANEDTAENAHLDFTLVSFSNRQEQKFTTPKVYYFFKTDEM